MSALCGSVPVAGCPDLPLRPGGLALTEALLDRAGFERGDLVVDIGCGQGASVVRMVERGLRAIGVDLAMVRLATARDSTGQTAFAVADGGELPLATASVHGVLAECSLSLMPDRPRALVEWVRVLRPGGHLAVSDVYSRLGGDAPLPLCRAMPTRATLLGEVSAAGLVVECFDDRSDALKEWVARFIFRHGSLDAAWDGAGGLAARRAAPGYFLMTAVKADRTNPPSC